MSRHARNRIMPSLQTTLALVQTECLAGVMTPYRHTGRVAVEGDSKHRARICLHGRPDANILTRCISEEVFHLQTNTTDLLPPWLSNVGYGSLEASGRSRRQTLSEIPRLDGSNLSLFQIRFLVRLSELPRIKESSRSRREFIVLFDEKAEIEDSIAPDIQTLLTQKPPASFSTHARFQGDCLRPVRWIMARGCCTIDWSLITSALATL